MVYVGQTIRPVKSCIKEHRVSRHFQEAKHALCQLRWAVLEVVRTPTRGGDIKGLLFQKEAEWIKKLDCLQPKGLNDSWNIKCFL
ncbi:hypothetical protein XELAEV_18008500mg [Xenopus laevis]|uniref:GIY-YIG domain-containing protein n=1 Tax=Xenopus laevis TaxID=8355 RepID=A0A974E329_XENLA|nr:hypothetical protein XELAEV_18008500mg [Xenopus laevis]